MLIVHAFANILPEYANTPDTARERDTHANPFDPQYMIPEHTYKPTHAYNPWRAHTHIQTHTFLQPPRQFPLNLPAFVT
jgi:hypothetical protein